MNAARVGGVSRSRGFCSKNRSIFGRGNGRVMNVAQVGRVGRNHGFCANRQKGIGVPGGEALWIQAVANGTSMEGIRKPNNQRARLWGRVILYSHCGEFRFEFVCFVLIDVSGSAMCLRQTNKWMGPNPRANKPRNSGVEVEVQETRIQCLRQLLSCLFILTIYTDFPPFTEQAMIIRLSMSVNTKLKWTKPI